MSISKNSDCFSVCQQSGAVPKTCRLLLDRISTKLKIVPVLSVNVIFHTYFRPASVYYRFKNRLLLTLKQSRVKYFSIVLEKTDFSMMQKLIHMYLHCKLIRKQKIYKKHFGYESIPVSIPVQEGRLEFQQKLFGKLETQIYIQILQKPLGLQELLAPPTFTFMLEIDVFGLEEFMTLLDEIL